jgi:hypothetical protein
MRMQLANVDRKEKAELAAIRRQADALRDRLA